MNKKVWIPILAAVALLAVLLVPVPTRYGFTALTYRLSPDLELTLFPNNFKAPKVPGNLVVEEPDPDDPETKTTFTAAVLEYSDSWVLVEPLEGEPERNSSDKISFSTANLEPLDIQAGTLVSITYDGMIMESYPAQIVASSWELLLPMEECTQIIDDPVDLKPVIYLYPPEETQVSVKLQPSGEFLCTYPAYDNGWHVTAAPDGTLTDARGQTYNYLYWEAATKARYDLTSGFCVAGKDTAAFLEDALAKLGLNRREANEFIVYWLPLMQDNPYNIISFQQERYTEAAKLAVSPEPDTLIRVFMAFQASQEPVTLPQQELTAPARNGFTVVEWGGTEIK